MKGVDNFNRNMILSFLRARGKLTISELSKLLRVSRPTIYLHLDVLEKKGLIERTKDTKKKGAPVTITPKEKAIEKDNLDQIIQFLKLFEEKEFISLEEIQKIRTQGNKRKSLFLDRGYTNAKLFGFIGSQLFLTEEGKKFLKENT